MRNIVSAALCIVVTQSTNAAEIKAFDALCIDAMEFANSMAKYQEYPLSRGNSTRLNPTGKTENIVVLFVNKETRSWTIAEKVGERTVCVIGMGDEFEPLGEDGTPIPPPPTL